MSRPLPAAARLAALCLAAAGTAAEPLSRRLEVDFFRDVPSRSLRGMAARADGRLVPGPVFTDLRGDAPAPLLWALEPGAAPGTWLIGTGPDGAIHEAVVDPAAGTYATREIARVGDAQVLTLRRLPDGSLLAGTSPRGTLSVIRDGQVIARTLLPADSVLDLLPDGPGAMLAATGNPGRIYRVDLARLTAAGISEARPNGPAELAARGVTLFGQIRDRNVRRLARLPDGRVAAGSAPRGNLYAFPADPGAAPEGGAPRLLQENTDAEVTDLLVTAEGDLIASVVFSPTLQETRMTPPAAAAAPGTAPAGRPGAEPLRDPLPPPPTPVRFTGRTVIVRVPARGLPEVLSARNNLALYRLARHGTLLLAAGGDQGDLAGYDLSRRLAVNFPGSASAQINQLAAAGADGRFLALRNNAPGLAWIDFTAPPAREAETRRLELPGPARIGAFRLTRATGVAAGELRAEIRLSLGTDEAEGWGEWTPLASESDGGWRAPDLHGRSIRLRLRLTTAGPFELDRGALHHLPQNRRPQLQEFRLLPAGFDLLPASEPPPSPPSTLGQLLQVSREEARGRGPPLSSPVVPAPGARVAYWNLLDPDGDNLTATFSIRREGEDGWIDLVAATRDPYARFNTRPLSEGAYTTRLTVSEGPPRPAGERITHTFSTDDLIVDHTAPEILAATARRTPEAVVITVQARDKLSLLEGVDVVFSHGLRETVRQPADGVRDGREETFVLEVPLDRAAGADAVELTVADAAGNTSTRRLPL